MPFPADCIPGEMLKVKPVGKIIILLLAVGIAVGAFRVLGGGGGGGFLSNLAPSAKTQESVVPLKADLPQINDAPTPASIKNVSMPGIAKAPGSSPEVRMLVWAWNAQMGLMFANGGSETTQGSLMANDGVNLKISRQDDGSKMQEALVEFATSLSRGNAQPDRGAHFVAIMGDGSATFLAALNKNLERLGPEYRAKVVGSSGFSRGEDKFMGPKEWKANPAAAKGGVVAGYTGTSPRNG